MIHLVTSVLKWVHSLVKSIEQYLRPLNHWECCGNRRFTFDYSKKYLDVNFRYSIVRFSISKKQAVQKTSNGLKVNLFHPVLKHGPRSITFRQEY